MAGARYHPGREKHRLQRKQPAAPKYIILCRMPWADADGSGHAMHKTLPPPNAEKSPKPQGLGDFDCIKGTG